MTSTLNGHGNDDCGLGSLQFDLSMILDTSKLQAILAALVKDVAILEERRAAHQKCVEDRFASIENEIIRTQAHTTKEFKEFVTKDHLAVLTEKIANNVVAAEGAKASHTSAKEETLMQDRLASMERQILEVEKDRRSDVRFKEMERKIQIAEENTKALHKTLQKTLSAAQVNGKVTHKKTTETVIPEQTVVAEAAEESCLGQEEGVEDEDNEEDEEEAQVEQDEDEEEAEVEQTNVGEEAKEEEEDEDNDDDGAEDEEEETVEESEDGKDKQKSEMKEDNEAAQEKNWHMVEEKEAELSQEAKQEMAPTVPQETPQDASVAEATAAQQANPESSASGGRLSKLDPAQLRQYKLCKKKLKEIAEIGAKIDAKICKFKDLSPDQQQKLGRRTELTATITELEEIADARLQKAIEEEEARRKEEELKALMATPEWQAAEARRLEEEARRAQEEARRKAEEEAAAAKRKAAEEAEAARRKALEEELAEKERVRVAEMERLAAIKAEADAEAERQAAMQRRKVAMKKIKEIQVLQEKMKEKGQKMEDLSSEVRDKIMKKKDLEAQVAGIDRKYGSAATK